MVARNRLRHRSVCADAVAVRVVEQWPSLADQVGLADELFGPDGPRKVGRWVDEQACLVGDSDFARTFSGHIRLPGIQPLDYAHRHIRTASGNLLGGIRFYARNTARPFVDVLAHSFDDLDALTGCVRAEWSNFNVGFLRLRTKAHLLADRPGIILDNSIHLARCHDIAPADGRVALERFDTIERALRLVADRYAHVAETNPVLSNNLSPAPPEDLHRWHEHDQLWAIRGTGHIVGALAVAPGAVGWVTGQEIMEEVVSVAYTGQRYATSAQCTWAHRRAADAADLLIGTVDRHNHASRAAAVRAGRLRVLDDIFVALDSSTPGASVT